MADLGGEWQLNCSNNIEYEQIISLVCSGFELFQFDNVLNSFLTKS